MHHSSDIAAYLEQANGWISAHLDATISPNVVLLPPLTPLLLDSLASHAVQVALTQPKHAWAITAVAEAAAAHTRDPFLQAQAHWQAARAANAWYRPDLVATAVTQARQQFTAAGVTATSGWPAACDWQQYAEPWLHNNFQAALASLEIALVQLSNSDRLDLVPHCRLSLAYCYILTAQFDAAEVQLDESEAVFQQQDDLLHQARCWLHRASALRRQLRYPEALVLLEKAQQVFCQMAAPVDEAKACYQLGYCELNQSGDFARAEEYFATAAARFGEREMALWQALCLNGLVQVHNNAGRLSEAYRLLVPIRETYERFPLIGLQADTAVESGLQSLYRGDWQTAVRHLQRAEANYQQLDLTYMVAMSVLYQGDTYLQAGHYHQALRCMEKALAEFERLGDDGRQADCHMRLGQAWLALGRDDLAYESLLAAADYFERTRKPAFFQHVITQQAEVFFRQQKQAEGIELLRGALALVEKRGGQLDRALVQRALGEALCLAGELDEGGQLLKTAVAHFQMMETDLEQAVCQLALGRYYQQTGSTAAARTAWETALALNQTAVPAISWQARAGLAALYAQEGNTTSALEQYRYAVAALARLRHNIWQPGLADSFLRRPGTMLDQAVALAGQVRSEYYALTFLEESKAQIVGRQLAVAATRQASSDELNTLAAEIRWLQRKVAASEVENHIFSSQFREWQQQIIQKAQQYDQKAAQLERQLFSGADSSWRVGDFDVAQFRQQAVQRLGTRWVALNYYLTASHLYGVTLTPTAHWIWTAELTPLVRLALNVCTKGGHGRVWAARHLAALGTWLIPESVQAQLTPETTLLVSPHRELHRLPWAALHVGQPKRPLITTSIPVIVPSWQSLLYLWQREENEKTAVRSGLMLAISDFQERHPALPQTREESARLRDLFGTTLHLIQEAEATAESLYQLAQTHELAKFDFLHIASHAFSDQLTGRLSGLALYDRDLWLDEMYQLTPLPPLVTLSACSGTLSRLLEGDEQVGLATACLAAGAQCVVGSLWPLLDEMMAAFMVRFYEYLRAENRPGLALAQTQREMYVGNMPAGQWGSLQCVGRP